MSSELQPHAWQSAVELRRLAEWMDSRGLEAGELADVHLVGGGTQNIVRCFRRGARQFVLRRPAVHLRSDSNEAMRREARVLAALAGTDVPHPALIAVCEDETVLGSVFYLMERVEGFNATVSLPPLHAGSAEARFEMGMSLVDAAVALSRVDYVAAGLGDFGKTANFLERQVPRWRSQLESYDENPGWPGLAAIPGVSEVADWLERSRPTSFRAGIVHGDFHLANVLFHPEGCRIAAIVDWELATVGDPLLDLGWLIATWPGPDGTGGAFHVSPWHGFPDTEDLVSRYAALSCRDMSCMPWYVTLACYKLGILLEGTYARACADRAPKETGARLHALTLALFERALRTIARPG